MFELACCDGFQKAGIFADPTETTFFYIQVWRVEMQKQASLKFKVLAQKNGNAFWIIFRIDFPTYTSLNNESKKGQPPNESGRRPIRCIVQKASKSLSGETDDAIWNSIAKMPGKLSSVHLDDAT